MVDQGIIHMETLCSEDEDRRKALNQLIINFAILPNKLQAWDDLIRLTQEGDSDVRAFANYSLGRASIFKATEAENEDLFRKGITNALEFFEASSREATYSHLSRFCLPFYRSFYTIAFKKTEAEDKVQKYLAEAKDAVGRIILAFLAVSVIKIS